MLIAVTALTASADFVFTGGVASATSPSPGYLSIIAGTGNSGTPSAGPATSSMLDSPSGVAVDSYGNVYIADRFNNEVEKVTRAGQLSIIAGTGTAGTPTNNALATSSMLDSPSGVAVDSAGNVYIADAGNYEVEKVTPAGYLSIIAGTGTSGLPTNNALATNSELRNPYGVAVDSAGNVYIADPNANVVEKVDSTGHLSIFAGTGTAGTPTNNALAASSMLNFPYGVAVDSTGNVYIADTYNGEIEKVDSAGYLSIFAGNGTNGTPSPGGSATSSRLNYPTGVAVDSAGNVYIADQNNHVIEKVTPGASGTLSIFAGTGTAGPPTNNALATNSMLNTPEGVAVDSYGNVYIADVPNNEVEGVEGSAVAPVFTADTPPAGTVGTSYSYTFAATGNPAPTFAVSSGTLPPGLTLDPATGVLSGTPTGSGTGTFTVTATNSAGSVATSSITLTFGAPAVAPVFTADTPPAGTIGTSYSYTFVATGNPAPTFAVSSGTLPPGLTLDPTTGVLSGTPTGSGSGTFTVTATNSAGTVATSSITLTFGAPAVAPVFTADTPPSATVGTSYSYTFAATGNPAPTFAVGTGTLPPGLTLDPTTGVLSGSPTGSGTFTFTITAANTSATVSSSTITIIAGTASTSRIYLETGGGVASTPNGNGYWALDTTGTLSFHGSASNLGSENTTHLNAPVIGVASTPDGHGYWEVAADGGVFSFGDAAFYGSEATTHLNAPVVGVASTPDGHGYWLVAADGGVFSFGDAAFYGSEATTHLNGPVVGVASTPDGHGYWLAAADGGVFSFGDAHFYGSLGATGTVPITGIIANVNTGYRLISQAGNAYTFGANP